MGKQKRSENTYQKINTIFLRDDKNVIRPKNTKSYVKKMVG